MRGTRVLTSTVATAAAAVLITAVGAGAAVAAPHPSAQGAPPAVATVEDPPRAGLPGVAPRLVRHWLRTLASLVDDEVITAGQARAIVVATRVEVRKAIVSVRDEALDALVADGVLTPGQARLLKQADNRRELRHIVRDLVRSGRLDADDAAAIRAAFREAAPDERPPLRDFLLAALDRLVTEGTLTAEQAEAVAAAFPGRPAAQA